MVLPAARSYQRSTGRLGSAAIGVSCAVGTVPLLCLIPGVKERLAAQAAIWGPRWNRGFAQAQSRVAPHFGKVEPRVIEGVKRVEPPMKKAALTVDRNIKKIIPENMKKE